MTIKVRFAPSPTGKLHLGNVRTAVINALFAKKAGGVFLLRMDDTDAERSTKEFEEGIKRDLRWLGLDWDEFDQQSLRMDRYEIAAEQLKADGRLYPCYETSVELDLMRKSLLQRSKPPIYDRASLNLSAEQIAAYEAEGRKPHWRFKLEPGEIAWEDMVRGATSFDAEHLSDPVLIREDGRPLYTLSSVVDDKELGVTDIIRGEDHVANTATQVQLFQAIGGDVPRFAHMPLVMDKDGAKLSKRVGSLAVEQMRDEHGFEPLAINTFLAKLGTNDAGKVFTDLDSLAADFDIAAYGRATPKLDTDELATLNAKTVRVLPFAVAADRLPPEAEPLWEAIRPNLDNVRDAAAWLDVILGDPQPVTEAEDIDFIASSAEHLPEGELDADSWSAWTGALKEASGRKGKQLFMPLRLALTGQARGPEMAVILPLIGREKVLARLEKAAD